MKKFLAYLVLFVVVFGSDTSAQTRAPVRTQSQSDRVWQGFGPDARERIRRGCVDVMRVARTREEANLEWFCRLSELRNVEADLGPWKKLVEALVRIFEQLRRLIYVGAVFMLLWIFVKGMYEGEAKWMHLGMLIIGVTMVAFAEVFIGIATNRINFDDIKNGDIYVDCRTPDEGLYICAPGSPDSQDHDERFIFQVSQGSGTRVRQRGLY